MKDNRYSPFDDTDWQISRALRKDARRSASDIARELDLKPRTVRNRIDKMVELGAARPYWVFEPSQFGYVIAADIFLEIDAQRADIIHAELLKLPQVSYLAYGRGKEALSIEGLFKTLEEMDDFIHFTLPAFEGVTVKSSALVPKVLRNLYEWEPVREDFSGKP